MKRSLIFGLIAVLSAGILFVGCSQATDSTETKEEIPVAGGVVIDHTVSTATNLKEHLMDTKHPEWQVIAFDISSGVSGFDNSTTIPAGKTVVLINSGSTKTIPVGTGGLIIEGKLIVGNNTGVSATTANKIFVGGTGSVEVQTGGALVIDDRQTVSNYVVNSTAVDSVLTKRVTFAGGSSLTITTEKLKIADISALLGYINAGITLSVSRAVGVSTDPSYLALEAPQNIMPSEIIQISGMNADRFLVITPVATETAAAITIPAGAAVTINQPLPTVKTLDVAGWVSAPSVGGTEAVKVTVSRGGGLEVPKTAPINFAAGSTIAAGGEFKGLPATTSEGQLTIEPGSTINDTLVKAGDPSIVPVISGTQLAAFEAGKTYQIVGDVTRDTAITVPADVTLLIPENASLSVGGISGAGKVVVEAGGKATGMPSFSTDTIGASDPANPDLEDVTIASTKYLNSGRIEIKLNGITGGLTQAAIDNIWTAAGSGKPSGTWSWVVIDNLLPAPVAGNMEIKQTNDAFRYYTGRDANHVSATPIESAQENAPQIYIPAPATGSPFKWKKYTLAAGEGGAITGQPADTATNGFGVLLWSAAASKTATIEIKPVSATVTYTVTVDWSGLTIAPAQQ